MYKRCTQYIYSYNCGKRENSCGYFRVDVRESECKITINIKMPGQYNMAVADVYAIEKVAQGECIKHLGKIAGLCGEICYKTISRTDNIAGDVYVNNLSGFIVCDGCNKTRSFAGNMLGSAVDVNMLLEKYEQKNQGTKAEETKCEGINEKYIEYGDDTELSKSMMECKECTEEYIEEKPEDSVMEHCEEKPEDSVMEHCEEKPEDSVMEHCEEKSKDSVMNDCKEKPESSARDDWQQLIFSNFPKVQIAFGGETAEAVKLRPHDLVWFPKRYWQLGSNQCLLRGYYNYRYILLVKCCMDNENKYYLAVPGKNCPMEAGISSRSGFGEFIKGYGNIGFWCHRAD